MRRKKLSKGDISTPRNFQHLINVKIDPKTGRLLGLPKQWLNIVEFETLNRRIPLISTEQTTCPKVVGASTSLSPSTSASFCIVANGTYSDTPILSPTLSLPVNSKLNGSRYQCSVENVRAVLHEFVDPDDPRNDLCNVSVLGSGSSSTVLQVYKTSCRKTMALKRMIIKDQQRPELLINELTVMKKCRHPNIVQYYSSHLIDEELWIIMEAALGGSLTDYLLKKRLSEESIATVSSECLDALSYLHSQGIIHRDLKSDSVLFTNNFIVKLSDFGFSTILTEQFPRRRSLLGTPFWLAPEVANREFYGKEADIWSFGITVIEMICGQPPNFDNLPSTAIEIIKNANAPKIPDEYNVSFELKSFVESMLVKDPMGRSSAEELRKHQFLKIALEDPSLIQL